MNIYGIYDIKEKEQCLRVGTLNEIVKFLDLTARELGRALKNNNLVRNRYKVCYLYQEQGELMTVEDAKKELREYRDNIKYIEEKQNDAEELRARIEKVTPNLTGLPNGKGADLEKAPLGKRL